MATSTITHPEARPITECASTCVMTTNAFQANFPKKSVSQRRSHQHVTQGELNRLTDEWEPSVVIVQEQAKFNGSACIKAPPDYWGIFEPTICSHLHGHSRKFPDANDDWEQGLAMFWRKDLSHADFWSGSNIHQGPDLDYRFVRYERGLYGGDRTREPRGFLVAPFIVFDEKSGQPQHIYVVNCHLTTIKGERNGVLEADLEGDAIRKDQIKVLLRGIISEVNASCTNTGRPLPYWIVGGDFNCKPTSPLLNQLTDAGLRDLNDEKGAGTKLSSDGIPTHTLDYLFGGLVGFPADEANLASDAASNPPPLEATGSDHLPVLARMTL